MGIRIEKLGLEICIGMVHRDWNWGLGMRIGIKDSYLGSGLEIADWDWRLEFGYGNGNWDWIFKVEDLELGNGAVDCND